MNTNQEKIKVSVIVPTYNSESYVEKAIISALNQDISKEIIIIDDYSVDSTEKIIEKYKTNKSIKYIKNPNNKGVAESRNIGIRAAEGEYVAFLDSDDWWEDNKLKLQVDLLEKNNGILCCTGRELVNEDGSTCNRIIKVQEIITYKMLLKNNSISCSSVVLKNNVAREFYMCNDELHEDYIMWLRILKKYNLAYGINIPLLKSRQTKGGKSRNKIKSTKMTYGVYRYIGVGRVRSLYYLAHHIINGVVKYWI